jgi:hypothetical protein
MYSDVIPEMASGIDHNTRNLMKATTKHKTSPTIMFFTSPLLLQKKKGFRKKSPKPLNLLEPAIRIELMACALRERRSTN